MTRALLRLLARFVVLLPLVMGVAAANDVKPPASPSRSAVSDFGAGLTAYNTGDYIKAFRTWMALAEEDDPRSQAGLGFLYHKGLGVVADQNEAAYWFEKAAEQGQAEAQLLLGVLYFYGKGVPQSFVQAFAWCELAQIHGSSDAMECRNVASESLSAPELKESFKLVTDWLARHRAAGR